MTIEEIVARLQVARNFLKEVEDALSKPDYEHIDEQYKIDVNRARDICTDVGLHLLEVRAR